MTNPSIDTITSDIQMLDLSTVVNVHMVSASASLAPSDLRWFVVQAYSGMEKTVERNIVERIQKSTISHKFGRVLVPLEEVIEIKNGQKKTTERKFFPGYVFVEMLMDDETWHLVKSTNKVTGFIGGGRNRPSPIPAVEVQRIMLQMETGAAKPRHKVEFEVGELVRVKEGAFMDYEASVDEINYEKSKARLSVTIFGRATPVEVDFHQIEKT